MKTTIIAEAGVNHNNDLETAYKLIDSAKQIGADVVKFQAALPNEVVTSNGEMAEYQINNLGGKMTQLEMTKNIHLSLDKYAQLAKYAKKIGIDFCSTSFGPSATKCLAKIDMPFWKIPSGEITNVPYIREICGFKKPIILSTGMATLGEIEYALRIMTDKGINKESITILHCTTDYPANKKTINLNAIKTMRSTFNVNVGYSDHTEGTEMSIAAVAIGARVIEKHLTLDKEQIGPDHRASLEPKEFQYMVSSIRNLEDALGDGVKRPTTNELKIIKNVRRSIVAIKEIKVGEQLTNENIGVKRPADGIPPKFWDEFINTKSKYNYRIDDKIKWQ